MAMMTLQLDGLHCGHCVKSVENALFELPTVRKVNVDLASQKVEIESDESLDTLVDAIIDIGFDAKAAE